MTGEGVQDRPVAQTGTQHQHRRFSLCGANGRGGFPALPGVVNYSVPLHPYIQELFLKRVVELSAWLLQPNLRGEGSLH